MIIFCHQAIMEQTRTSARAKTMNKFHSISIHMKIVRKWRPFHCPMCVFANEIISYYYLLFFGWYGQRARKTLFGQPFLSVDIIFSNQFNQYCSILSSSLTIDSTINKLTKYSLIIWRNGQTPNWYLTRYGRETNR